MPLEEDKLPFLKHMYLNRDIQYTYLYLLSIDALYVLVFIVE